MFRSTLVIATLALLLGCPGPSLNDDDDAVDDDDTVLDDDDAVDDDDTVLDDDDVAEDDDDFVDDDDAVDDDDIAPTEFCEEIGQGSAGYDAWGAPTEGAWIAGELAWDGENLSVAPEVGPTMVVQPWWSPAEVDMEELMAGIVGPGQLFWSQGGTGPWTAYGVLGAVTDAGDAVAFGFNTSPPASFADGGFGLDVDPDFAACPELIVDVDGCGMGSALPVSVTITEGDTAIGTIVWPTGEADFGDKLFRLYTGFHVPEPICDDFDGTGWSWSLHVP